MGEIDSVTDGELEGEPGNYPNQHVVYLFYREPLFNVCVLLFEGIAFSDSLRGDGCYTGLHLRR